MLWSAVVSHCGVSDTQKQRLHKGHPLGILLDRNNEPDLVGIRNNANGTGSTYTPGKETSVTLPVPRADFPSQTQHPGIHPRQCQESAMGLGLETLPGGQPRRPTSARPDRRGPRAGEGATSADPRALQPGATCPGVPAVQSPLGSRLSSRRHMTRDLRGAPGRTSDTLAPGDSEVPGRPGGNRACALRQLPPSLLLRPQHPLFHPSPRQRKMFLCEYAHPFS
ncbi:hypothetical protein LEMLEM_LOCUS10193 [Lemmus lemmus]